MKKSFKITALFIVAAILFITFGQNVLAEEDLQTQNTNEGIATAALDGDYEYEDNSTGVTIIKYNGSATDIIIPNNINGKAVTAIGAHAFTHNKNLATVTIPDSVVSIGEGIFAESLNAMILCNDNSYAHQYAKNNFLIYKLSSGETTPIYQNFYYNYLDNGTIIIIRYVGNDSMITIPNEIASVPVTAIGCYAFIDKQQIQNINIPESINTIGWQAFYSCKGLTKVKIPKSVTSNSPNMRSAYLWDNIEYLKGYWFSNCTSLKEVEFEDGATIIPKGALSGCDEGYLNFAMTLDTIIIPSTVKIIEDWAFSGLDALTSITIPENVEKIGNAVFWRCSNLKKITFPKSLNELGDSIAYSCTNLDSIEFLGNAPKQVGDVSNGANPNFIWSINGGSSNPNLTIYYQKGATGFTNPWGGYPTKPIDGSGTTPPLGSNIKNVIKPNTGIQQGNNANVNGSQMQTVTGLSVSSKTNTAKTASQFKSMFNVPANQIEIVDANGNAVADNNIMATGMIMKLKDTSGNVTDQAAVVVMGDIAGRGKADLLGYAMLKGFRLSLTQLNDLQQMAADMNNDGKIALLDQAMIKGTVLGLI